MRRARNNVRIAYEKQTETLRQLQKDVEQAVLDREGYAKETNPNGEESKGRCFGLSDNPAVNLRKD